MFIGGCFLFVLQTAVCSTWKQLNCGLKMQFSRNPLRTSAADKAVELRTKDVLAQSKREILIINILFHNEISYTFAMHSPSQASRSVNTTQKN